MHTITNTISISAPPARLVPLLSTVEGNRAWWTLDCDRAGDVISFRFQQPTHTKVVTFRIDRADERGVAMTCIAQENNPDWLGTVLTYDLSVPGQLTLTHAGYPAINECFSQCTKGWAYFLASLKGYLDTGAGTPFKPAAAA